MVIKIERHSNTFLPVRDLYFQLGENMKDLQKETEGWREEKEMVMYC